ncbi:MAG: GNAT family N-acetyltransferase [Methylibium sp.]|nr:GNAT family N-acetyltransferase [Methylibium sp.]
MPVFLNLPLRTERLLLRPYRPADAQALLDIFSDPLVMRYWSSPPWTSIDQAHAAIERDAKSLESGEHLRLGLERLEDGRLLGQCTLFAISAQCRRAEIGYGLAASAWGHGYMHEALRALVAYGFENLDLNRIEADIDPRNTASARSLERLGFAKEGYLRERWIVGDEVSDSAMYGLLRKDWSAGASR